jgi:predicted transcriptional regulator
MSRIQAAVHAIARRGEGTADDIVEDLGCTRQQAINALQNARHLGHLIAERQQSRGEGGGRGSRPALYRVPAKSARAVASVWQLAA